MDASEMLFLKDSGIEERERGGKKRDRAGTKVA